MRTLPLLLAMSTQVLLTGALSQEATAATIRVEGIDSGVVATSPTLAIVDQPPLLDPLEFRVFYAASASNGSTTDYDGMAPILEADLVADAAHLFVLEKSGEFALFVVYKRQAGTQSADATLAASGGDFNLGSIIVEDAAEDDYAIVAGNIVTTHRILVGGRTDGYVAALAGRFESAGDTMTFDLSTPAAGTSDLALTSIQVYTGTNPSGDPIWAEVDSGPFSASTPRRVELTLLAANVSLLGDAALTVLAITLALIGAAAITGIPASRSN